MSELRNMSELAYPLRQMTPDDVLRSDQILLGKC